MIVVIVGSRDRKEKDDFTMVHGLLDSLKAKYPKLLVVTTGCDRGVGKIIRNRLLPEDPNSPPEIEFIEYSVRIYPMNDLAKSRMANIHISKNATFLELGEEFHIFEDARSRGPMEDLRERCEKLGRPYARYLPGKTEPVLTNWAAPR